MDSQRLEFWINFILHKSGFPAPERLAAQFAAASFSEFYNCGCNSFKVTVSDNNNAGPIAKPSDHSGAVFSSDFYLDLSGKSLELILFANEAGNLSYVEIDCNANSEPVPEFIQTQKPYHVYASPGLAP
ncbi:MAG: hypothetical protein ACRES7_12150 [Gammaproteobacteria bacterium]